MLEQKIKKWVMDAIDLCRKNGDFDLKDKLDFEVTTPKQLGHGDFTTNAALVVAAKVGKKPRDVAALIANSLQKNLGDLKTVEVAGLPAEVEVAGPGFINFKVEPLFYLEAMGEIAKEGEKFGRQAVGKGKKIQVEFVSANPTGPLHIGHGRGAVYGDTLANVFTALGYDVTKEYYVNDVGGQMRTLGRSVYLRIKELNGETIEFPPECYQGHYIVDIAREVKEKLEKKLPKMTEDEAIGYCTKFASTKILGEIRRDLALTGVVHDTYFFENKLHADSLVDSAITKLRERGHIFDEEGAIWFRSTAFGDDKDRVLQKSDGSLTYFAADIAYHKNKFERGFDRVIDVWGADHGGYVARIKACIAAFGYDPKNFDAVLIQLVNLMREGKMVSMSTRSATYETLEDVRKEVGRDVCRYFFLMRSHNAQLDFDLELAKKQTVDNPVYYIQYAHARICSIFRKAAEGKIKTPKASSIDLKLLDLPEEARIARTLCEYPTVLSECAEELEPHKLTFYLLELAKQFQSYYSKGRTDPNYRVIGNEPKKTAAKLYFLNNIRTVLKNALAVLGISAPEEMKREEE